MKGVRSVLGFTFLHVAVSSFQHHVLKDCLCFRVLLCYFEIVRQEEKTRRALGVVGAKVWEKPRGDGTFCVP